MTTEIKVPALPESVTDATVAKWHKKEGESVSRDENLLDLETDKVMLEVPAPQQGVIGKIVVKEGSVVKPGDLLAVINEAVEGKKTAEVKAETKPKKEEGTKMGATVAEREETSEETRDELSPAVRRMVSEANVDISKVKGTGKSGRVTKEDVENYIASLSAKKPEKPAEKTIGKITPSGNREEKRVPMSRLRARIAERLVQAQHEAAMLTTFNEINMKPLMDLRNKYKDTFEKQYNVRLGFMSFFTKACVEALKRFPAVNASIDGNDIIYHNYYDIGIAVSSPRGLVVPIIRDADLLSMSGIELQIKDYAEKSKDGSLTIEEMTGGTFTITNGGVFGSMLSTPILNPPQTGILGMHNIVERPVVENNQVVIRPIMYVALSYDHRVIDGRESVSFLKTVKELIEDPTRLVLGI